MRGEFPREVSKDRNHLSGSHIPSGLKIKQPRLHCCAWHRLTLNFAVSYSSSQAASFVLRFRVNKVNKSKQSILECSCAKKTACPNQNLLILFLNYNIISMGELHSLVLHGMIKLSKNLRCRGYITLIISSWDILNILTYLNHSRYQCSWHPSSVVLSFHFVVGCFIRQKFHTRKVAYFRVSI